MNWKKWIKYTGVAFIILIISSFYFFNRGFTKMYGGYTKIVDVQQFEAPIEAVFIEHVNILASDGEHFIENQSILIEAGKIVAMDSLLEIPTQVKRINGQGKYLIPGLIDSHVHLFKSPNDLLLYIANGVTEIKELIGDENKLAWKQEIEQGRIGPKMWVASPPLGSINKFSDWFISFTRGAVNVNTANEAKQQIKALFDEGYDGIKIYSHLNKESYLAATKTATDLGMPVIGHIPWQVELDDIWENGQSEIAHLEEIMNTLRRDFRISSEKDAEDFLKFVTKESDELANKLIENNISVTTTLWLTESFVKQKFDLNQVLQDIELEYVNPGMSEGVKFGSSGFGWLPETNLYRLPEGLNEDAKTGQKRFWTAYAKACQVLVYELSKRGVNIMAGTDANLPPTVPGFSFHDELLSLQQAGLTPSQVLRAATAVPAQWLKRKAGEISVGFDANLVLLNKNPLLDIRHTRTIDMVFANGKTFDRSLLDQLLAAVKEANDESRMVDISGYER